MSTDLYSNFDGATGSVYRFQLRDESGIRNMASAAVEIEIFDHDGVQWGTLPGVIIGAKADGTVDLQMKGRESDWNGSPKDLYAVPKVYYATAPDGTPAVNLLLNPSFDAATGASPARLPDSWTLTGTRTATWDNHANEAVPPVIYAAGTFQSVVHATTSEPDYISQSPAVTLAVGDPLSVGCWHRMRQAIEAKNDNHGIFFRAGTEANTIIRFEVVESDWYFKTGTVYTTVAASAATMGLDARGTTGSNRYDEAFAFKGLWASTHAYARKIHVHGRSRIPKASNQIAGFGSFEQDTDANGVADAWLKLGTGGTFTIDRDPANVSHGRASQKVVLTDQSGVSLRHIARGRFKVGDTWRASVKAKTTGTLSSGSGTGGFNITLKTNDFDGAAVITASTNLGVTLATFTDHAASLAITTADRSELVIDIPLNGKSGTMYLDDVRLERTVAGP